MLDNNLIDNSGADLAIWFGGIQILQKKLKPYIQACPWEMSHGMGWDGTARIAFPMGPMGQ